MDGRQITRLLLLALAVGCDRDTAPSAALPAPTFGNATIVGHVRFLGDPPQRQMIDVSTCRDGAKAYQEETIVVGPSSGLHDVIVYLKDAPASDGSAQPALTLDQVDCRYVPHVLAVQVGQTVNVRTSDAAFHNVHWTSERNGDVNIGMSRAGESQTRTFARPEFIRVRCDVHPWMEGYVGVVSSPFFATTTADGGFTIARVPAGRYTLATWHALLGERETAIDVKDGDAQTLTIDYAPPMR